MKNLLSAILLLLIMPLGFSQTIDYVGISSKLVASAKSQNGKESELMDIIAKADETILLEQLKSDTEKKAFFINVYNAFTNISLRKNPDQYKDRGAFFKSEQFTIAGNKVSLDNIEHDFLRRSSIKWSLGALHKIFPSKLERKFRVEDVDYRIHFSLNCGAKSCPPVGIYDAKNLDKQLDASTDKYLKANSSYDAKTDKLIVPALMSWFRGDFGNKRGVWEICRKFNIIPEDAKPKLSYKYYDWTLDIDNFL
ncbi:DUF547 domain-containing protein [Flavobacterium algicola]|uniref:DUF547 domain-containing protein n=1 Tax=Flavobacterium algicola TaxID=556529 RepID=UPI001EFDF3AA|nr:DUF547 domain-containing protein [Flavobacterium algicola]MCG9793861.1 DUF547 domain-containing protein [Flavobacterium algicola]